MAGQRFQYEVTSKTASCVCKAYYGCHLDEGVRVHCSFRYVIK